MATTVFGTVKYGSTSVSLDILLLKKATNDPDTGLAYTDLTAYYYQQGQGTATTSISLSALSFLNSTFSEGGVFPIGDGSYRLDAPNGMWSETGSPLWVELTVKSANSLYKERFMLESAGASDIYDRIGIAGAGLTALGDTRLDNLDAAVSTRSTYSGGAVASVTAGVTVTTNNDKTGYKLASDGLTAAPTTVPAVTVTTNNDKTGYSLASGGLSGVTIPAVTLAAAGLDAVIVETAAGAQAAINARQALSLIVCASPAGIVTDAGTTTITVKNPGNTVSRIVATVDDKGNRSAVTLTPPA